MGNPQNASDFDAATTGAASQSNTPIDQYCVPCNEANWIKLRYEYEDGIGVAGAAYVVQATTNDGTPTGDVLAEGFTDADGNAEV